MTTEPEAIPADVLELAKEAHTNFARSSVTDNLTTIIARAILADRASRAPVDGAGWRPIETAPKGTALDGLRVDIWLEPIPERQALFANPSTKGRRLVNAWHVKRPDYTGWRNEGSWNGRELNWRATHWMPLPTAPGTHPAPASPDAELVRALRFIMAEAERANNIIRLNRDGGGQGRVGVATAMHRIEQKARSLLSKHGGDR